MAAQPLTAPDELTTRPLGPRDGPETWRFLTCCGARDVYIASQVWRGVLDQRLSDGLPEFHGVFAGERLRALLLLGYGGLAMPAGPEARVVAALGPVLARRAGTLRALIGERANVDALWPYAQAAGARPRLDAIEIFMTVDAEALVPEAREPELRVAVMEDLELIARASARAHVEEMGEDPMARNREAFVGRVARLILEERVFVVRRGPALPFKAELSALCPLGAQIAGVYTEPEFRNRGLARRGTAEVARRALATTPTVCLFVRQDNAPARRAYERGGFRYAGEARTMIFADLPAGPRA
jgi:ribosomal protein S18 acetylase RimI-like enzyme